MKKYKDLEIELLFFQPQDIITNSPSESADDIGGWNSDWFASWNSDWFAKGNG